MLLRSPALLCVPCVCASVHDGVRIDRLKKQNKKGVSARITPGKCLANESNGKSVCSAWTWRSMRSHYTLQQPVNVYEVWATIAKCLTTWVSSFLWNFRANIFWLNFYILFFVGRNWRQMKGRISIFLCLVDKIH